MATEAPTLPQQTAPTASRHDLDRAPGVDVETRTHRKPARHGGGGKFVIHDLDRPAEAVRQSWSPGEHRNVPDGSAYQHARAAWYAHEDDLVTNHKGKSYAVLTRDYQHPEGDEAGTYAVTLRSSRWRAGRGTGASFTPFYKYNLTVQPLDEDGEILWQSTPSRSLSVTLIPQVEGMVYEDGNDLEIPHGEGTFVDVQSTWVDQPEVMVQRASHLLGHVLDYQLESTSLNHDSLAFIKAEAHARFDEAKEGDVVHTIRQSQDLLAEHSADISTEGTHENDRWIEAKLRTADWHKLGFPRFNAPILLKAYYPDNPNWCEYPMDQPKIEVALNGKETVVDDETGESSKQYVPWDRWEEVMAVLEEILLSHLEWADVGEEHLVADDYYDGADAPPLEFEMPVHRREQLRKHYESLVPAIYREATRLRTNLTYDILQAVRQAPGPLTYEQLVNRTGAAYRTVRKHVRRLADGLGGDGPGILERKRGAVTLVAFSSRFLEEIGQDALDQINPADTPADRDERADERRQQRDERQSSDGTDDDSTSTDDQPASSVWRYFADVDLTADRLATALDSEYLDGDEVRVRVDQSPLFAYEPPD